MNYPHQECRSPFVVDDLKPFESDERVTKKVVTAAMEQRLLASDSSLLACPSPNCEGVFRRFTFMALYFISSQFGRLEKGDELQEGESFLCQLCGSKICRRYFSFS